MNTTNSISSQDQNFLVNVVCRCFNSVLIGLKAVVNRVALGIFFETLISLSLLYLHHNLFALGFVVGFIFDKQMRCIADDVNNVYNANRTFVEKLFFFGGGAFFALYTMPTSMIIATLYHSSQIGAWINHSNRKSASHPIHFVSISQSSSPSNTPSLLNSTQNMTSLITSN